MKIISATVALLIVVLFVTQSSLLVSDGETSPTVGDSQKGQSHSDPTPTGPTVDPWPMNRYNITHSGASPTNAPENSAILWSNSTGLDTWGSPVIADGRVYIAGGDAMHAFDHDTGQPLWSTPLDSPLPSGYSLTSTPAYSNGMLFYGGDKIYGVDATTGVIRWRVPTGSPFYGDGSPTVSGNMVYIGGEDRKLYAIEQMTGNVIWTFQTGFGGPNNYGLFSSPAVWGGYVYLAACDGYVYQINETQSSSTATYYHRFATGNAMYGSPVIYGGNVIIGNGYYPGPLGTNKLYALRASDLTQVWRFPATNTPVSFFSSVAVANDTIFTGSIEGNLYAIDPATGVERWRWNIGQTWSSPGIASGKLFIGNKAGNVYSFNASQIRPTNYNWMYSTGADVSSSPAISDGRMCVGTNGGGGQVICFGESTIPVDDPPTVYAWEPGGTLGQSYIAGTSVNVRWLATDDNLMPMNNINISYGDGSVWTDIIRNAPNVGTFSWDTAGVPTGSYYVNVSAFDSKGQSSLDTGNYTFQIVSPPDPKPTVIAFDPGGTPGQSYTVGQAVQVRWLATDDKAMPADNVNISYGNGGSWNDVVRNTQNDGVFSWDTISVTPGSYFINVTVYDSIGQLSWDVANYSFQIVPPVNQPPSTTITQPIGGDSWSGGSLHDIAFTANDAEDLSSSLLVWVNYSLTGGAPFNFQVAGLQGVPGTSSPYTWTVPAVDSTTVVLNSTVIDTDGAKGYAVSALFEIDSTAPSVSSTNPSPGATGVPISANVLTTWSESMNTTNAELSFSLKDTVTWTPVAGMFSWAGAMMTFNPIALLAPGTQYSANITVDASDDSSPGNYLAAPYVWTFTTSAGSDKTKPTLSAVTAAPDPQECSLPVNVSALIQDDVAVGEAWLDITSPPGDAGNLTMSFDSASGRYFRLKVCRTLGLHTFMIWAADTSGNWNWAAGQFNVTDTTMPSISDLRAIPNPDEVHFVANISAVVSDNCQLSEVWLNVTAPDFSTWNLSMNPGPRRYLEVLPDQIGTYDLRIWASDAVGHWQRAFGQLLVRDTTPPVIHAYAASPNPLEVFSTVNISATVTDNFLLSSVHVNITRPDMTWTNRTMTGAPPTFSHLFATDIVGTHTFIVSAVDSSSNWAKASGSFLVRDTVPPAIEHAPRTSWLTGLPLNVTANVTDNYSMDEARLDYIDVAGASHNVTMTHGAANAYHFIIGGQPHSGKLTYFLWSNDSSGNEARTQSYSISIVGSPPKPPTGLNVVPGGRGTLVLNWTAPTKNVDESDLTDLEGYIVFRMNVSNGSRTRVVSGLVTGMQLTDSGLSDGTRYSYVVRAVNSSSVESADSNEASGTTMTPTEPGRDAFPILSVVLIIVAVVVASFAILLLLMRKRKREGEIAKEEDRDSLETFADKRQTDESAEKDRWK